jgi:DNA-binding HxlR family transcriptional regulator
MKGYGQFCPIAKASEVLGERWTNLVIRELIAGSESFSDLRRGLPLISPSLLSARLKSLERAGVVVRTEDDAGISYKLTEAGLELKPIIMQLGVWGHRWARSDLSKGDLDPSLLMWDIHRNLNPEPFTAERTVLLFEFTDYPSKFRRWWLVIQGADVDVCLKDPGHDVDLHLSTDLKSLTQVWMGDVTLMQALRTRVITLSGSSHLKKSIAIWLGTNFYADVKPARQAHPA